MMDGGLEAELMSVNIVIIFMKIIIENAILFVIIATVSILKKTLSMVYAPIYNHFQSP